MIRLIDADALRARFQAILDRGDMFCEYDIIGMVDNAPTVEITEEQAIDKLHDTGWLPRHDKEMTERPTVEPCYQTTSCLDCKMYDKENHHCPRFCEVIRELVKEAEE